MANELRNQERLPDNLKKQLALAVRSIQWSYAIFWSNPTGQPGVLEWADGYYNGDIKTRKTVQSIELNADELGLQRSEQLRELYESLSAGEANPQARRPSAALSPEDLTDTEWYYLVCMSFVFDNGQGLPGTTLANGHPTWLCNAPSADSKIFSRSLLAKTVVCFPFMRGVVELGVSEQVLEDPSLIQHIKTSFLEIPYTVTANHSSAKSDKELACATFNREIHDTKPVPVIRCRELDTLSPDDNSNDQAATDSIMVEGLNGGASQVQSWQFMDDDFSNRVHHPLNSSDSVSQTIVDPVMLVPFLKDGKVNGQSLQDIQDCNHKKLTALNLQSDDLHYQSVLSCLLKTSHPLILGPNVQNCYQEPSFVSWKKAGLMHSQKLKSGTPQKLLKKILFEVPRMHVDGLLDSPEYSSDKVVGGRPEADEIGASHVLSERRRREKLNKRFMILKSIVPSISKVDKVSILDDTIQYLQELERKVEELECRRELLEAITKRKPEDTVERTSDNCGSNKIGNGKNSLTNKRKAPDIDEMEPDTNHNISKDGSADDITVSMNKGDVVIEIKCLWREGILLEIMDAASHLHLDSHSVQSSIMDGILSLTIKSKHKGLNAASVGTIKHALQMVAGNLFSNR
ncbi:transcription factor EGL1 isoform X2 [Populus trichocarpa]|uniref:transcription factor EGL1 isoform X2 n=1 Tax=Populus trichocarpa TaxID=3694 RepID=UPI00019372EF|nr:transcription factor EGL1 isoform X2 [Populus trichocarpa]